MAQRQAAGDWVGRQVGSCSRSSLWRRTRGMPLLGCLAAWLLGGTQQATPWGGPWELTFLHPVPPCSARVLKCHFNGETVAAKVIEIGRSLELQESFLTVRLAPGFQSPWFNLDAPLPGWQPLACCA